MDPVTTRVPPAGLDAWAPAGASPPGANPAAADPADPADPLAVLLERLLHRPPRPRELALWQERLAATQGAPFLHALMAWPPVLDAAPVKTHNPPGHPSSPVVDPRLVGPYVEEARAAARRAVAGVPFDLPAMAAFFARHGALVAQTLEAGRAAPALPPFAPGDAAVLAAMVAEHRPARVVAVGPGAAIPALAAALAHGPDVDITLIDPAAERFRPLIGRHAARADIRAEPVQGHALAPFAALGPGDILLVETSHVLKTGSDLNYLLFHVLPVLAPGVVVQFAGCRFPFEYSNAQIFDKNTSWNELYAVRALLMYSSRFKVLFSGSVLVLEREALVREVAPAFLKNPGGALWVEVVDDGAATGLAAVGGLQGFAAAAPAPVTPAVPAVTLTRLPPRRPGGPPLLRAEVRADGARIPFDVVDGDGPAFFALGVRKSGSTMFNKILAALAKANGINDVNLPGTFFRHGLSVAAWARQDLSPLVRPGNLYTGFRSFPGRLAATDAFRGARKAFMHRDPRDAIVSQYFSDAFSHDLPEGAGRQRFLEKREAAQGTQIDAWVIANAPSLGRTLEAFAPLLSDPACLVLPYEAYVFEKRTLIDRVLDHFGWSVPEERIDALIAEIDVRPEGEDPTRFVRKATPGDHREKLTDATVAELGTILARPLALFGYA